MPYNTFHPFNSKTFLIFINRFPPSLLVFPFALGLQNQIASGFCNLDPVRMDEMGGSDGHAVFNMPHLIKLKN